MPELPEVDAVVKRFWEDAAGARVTRVRVERPATVKPQSERHFKVLEGRRIEDARRRAKYIFLQFEGGVFVEIHLRMTGNLYVAPDWRFRPNLTRLWMELEDGRAILFVDPRALGRVRVVKAEDVAAKEAELGPEPLEAGFTVERLGEILAGVRAPIKPVLMDQSRVAGIGNIYASEALWYAKIDPRKPAGEVPKRKWKDLHAAIQKVLSEAVSSAYREYTTPGTLADSESFGVMAYGREGEKCQRCPGLIQRVVQGGRSTYFCGKCQR